MRVTWKGLNQDIEMTRNITEFPNLIQLLTYTFLFLFNIVLTYMMAESYYVT